MKNNFKNDKIIQDIDEFEQYLNNIKIPIGTNQPHKNLLFEKINKEQEILPKIKKVNKAGFSFKSPYLKYGLALTLFIVTISFSIIISFNQKKGLFLSLNIEKGNGYVNGSSDYKNDRIKESDIIKTDKNSELTINVENSTIRLYEESEIQIIGYNKKNKDIKNRFRMTEGKIYCQVKLPSKNSIFEVETENASFTVRGTKFLINISKNKDVILQVDEGIVEISNYIKIKSNENNNKLSKNLELFGNVNESINKGEKIIIRNTVLQKFNNDLNIKIKENGSNEKDLIWLDDFKSRSKKLVEKLNNTVIEENLNLEKNNFLKENNPEIKKNKSFIIKKIGNFSDTPINEKGTGISASKSEANIFVSSDSNKTIYCINSFDGSLNWSIKDKRISKITGLTHQFNKNIFVCSPNRILILNEKGTVILENNFKKGIDFWPDLIESDNVMYIPTAQGIYTSNNNNIQKIENFPDPDGQIYISKFLDKIFCFNLNTLEISVYDLNEKKIISNFRKLQNRAFMSPVISNNNLYIADINGNIYKYNIMKTDESPKTISINTGIMNLIVTGDMIYFIANDGWFYKVNGLKFDSIEKVIDVDANPDPDKYLTKKNLLFNNYIYFSSDSGNIFCYNIIQNKWNFLQINDNIDNNPLIGSPVNIESKLFFIDNMANIYEMSY